MSVNVGEVVGSYRIVSPLGEGGLGVVYLAAHKLIGREAAVKVLRPEFCDATMVSRFFDDAKMTTSIKHPGIVDIYDFGYSETGRPYIVMERLQGDTLTQRLQHAGGPLSPHAALAIVRQIASTLGAAHDRGVIHRGLKPDNIFLIRDVNATGVDRVKVLDFGVAKLQATDAHLFKTATGMVLGEPSYMAPEQCIGSPSIDGRADLYALGCILFHMICGRPPFVGAGIAQVLAAHVNMAPPPPTSIVPDTPPEVERMILNLLDKSPQRRPQRAGELVIEIDAILPRLPTTRAAMAGPPPMPPGKPMARTMFAGGAVPAPALNVQAPPPIPRRAPPTEPPPSPYSNGNGHPPAHSNGNGALPPGYSPNEMGPYGYPMPSQQPSAPIPTQGPPPPAPPLETVGGGVYDGGLRRRNNASTSAEGSRRGRLGLIIVLLALAAGGVSAYFIATSVDVSSAPKTASKSQSEKTKKEKKASKTAPAKKGEPAKAEAKGGDKVAAKTAESEKPAEPGKVETPAPAATASIDAGAAAAPPPPTAPAPAPEKSGSVVMVFVTLDTEPTGAQVFVDDKQVGTTPYRGEVASGTGNGSYVVKLAGFKDATVLVPRDRSFAETVKLEKGTGTGAAPPIAGKAEPAKAEPAKAEPAKAEPAKAAPPKADPPKADPIKPVAAEVKSKSTKPRRPRRERPARDEDELFDENDGGGESRPSKAGGKRRPKRDLLDL